MLASSANPYYPGNDAYNRAVERFGSKAANAIYMASLVDDGGVTLRNALNDAVQVERGRELARPGSDSTAENLYDQLTTDPLAAPLDTLNDQLGKAVWNVVRNPFVLALAAGLAVFWLWPKIKKYLA